ncbi:MAG: hypothetical protein K9H64_15170 [Bacteroidales bacterium]|nr:hypothetical protein [Bacteroidales bacterium]MCF8457287.1 hypothetical protein [Bacteroidales bacterium]
MKAKNLILFIVAGILLACANNSEKKIDIKGLTFEELFNYSLSVADSCLFDSIARILDDSILSYSCPVLVSYNTEDSIHNYIGCQFNIEESNFFEWDIKERNIFVFQITEFDTLFAEGEKVDNIDSIHESIKEFISNPFDLEHLPEKKDIVIKYFDTISIPKCAFFINSLMYPDSLGNRTSWKKLVLAVNKICDVIEESRNDLSQARWGMDFKDLPFDQQVSISTIYPFRIWIFTNNFWNPVPPPPRPLYINKNLLKQLME